MMVTACALLLIAASMAHAGTWLLGDLSITDDSGKRFYGQYISVFLTRQAIPVPHDEALPTMERHKRMECINQMHMTFFKTFSRHRFQSGYLVAHGESSDTGNFAFLDLAPGDYFVVVTFPTLIDGHKVAWQQPVTIRPGRTAYVSLNSENLVLPTVKR